MTIHYDVCYIRDVKSFPAFNQPKIPSLKKTLAVLILCAFPLSTLGVVFLCVFFLTPAGQNVLSGEVIKKGAAAFFAASPPVLGAISERYESKEAKAEIINQYFSLQNAPLSGYGSYFTAAAEKYNLPWTLLPAIAMQESNGGKKIPEGTFNAWGWGITASDTLGFDTWEHGIETVARGLRRDYFDKGRDTVYEVMEIYCPLSLDKGGSWAKGVEYFQLELASF